MGIHFDCSMQLYKKKKIGCMKQLLVLFLRFVVIKIPHQIVKECVLILCHQIVVVLLLRRDRCVVVHRINRLVGPRNWRQVVCHQELLLGDKSFHRINGNGGRWLNTRMNNYYYLLPIVGLNLLLHKVCNPSHLQH